MFKGSFVALVTPFNEDSSVNYDKLGHLIDWHIDCKTDGLVMLGTTSETPALTDEERVKIVKFALERAKGKILVIAGCGFNNTDHSRELAVIFDGLGVDGLLIVNPYYNKGNNEGIIKHYQLIADSVKTPIILYNVPSRTGKNIDYDVVCELAKHKNIVAIKDASGDLNYASRISKNIPNFNILSGNDDIIVPLMSIGATGVISVAANIIPKEMAKMVRSYLEKKPNIAKEIQLKYLDLINALFIEVNPIPVREAMNYLGFNIGLCRLPLYQMNPENKRKLINELIKYDL